MRFYSMSHESVYGLPLTTFWMLDRNISRIKAEEEQRQLRLSLVAQSGDQDTIKDYMAELSSAIGNPIVQKAVMEQGAIKRLKVLMGVQDEQ